uniref:TRAF3-interacting protein 1 C-terminal domain-containing protein n=1 Tax=Micrurus surinamensis TaxID=129470 RepID=A0A2D4PUJ5_MICSU
MWYNGSEMTSVSSFRTIACDPPGPSDLYSSRSDRCSVTIFLLILIFISSLSFTVTFLVALSKEYWKQRRIMKCHSCKNLLKRITDGVVEPLKIELTELDQLIKDEEDKIYTKRANVLRNNEKIQKMVHIINSRR